ncbi:MAG TPA: SIMPL domain-containing protein [Candidatus Elarobacter sp.]
MKTRIAIAVLVLFPLAAGAQVPVPVRQPVTGPAAGITVLGRASVRVPVRTVRFLAYARGIADEQDVLSAMRSAGVEDPILGPGGFGNGSNGQTLVRGTITGASRAKLERIAAAAADYVRAHPGLALDNVQFAPRLDDCATFEETARTQAIADARRRAGAIAAAAGLALGPVTGVNENGGCQPEQDPPFFNGPGAGLDVATLTSALQLTEVVTFAAAPVEQPARRHPL